MINPVFLRTFMTLAETSHFTRTAETLHMTQPGVSQHIKKLESELGKPLLNRFGKRFELTSAGESLYQYGLQQAEAESRLMDIIHSDNPYTGELKLTCSGSIAMLLYPKLLNIQKQHSELIVSVEAAPNLAIVDRVASLQSDVGIVTQPVKDSSLALSQIGEDELCLILPAGVTLSWEALLELGFINHPDGYHYATQILEKNFKDEFSGMNQIPASGKVNQLSQILTPVSMGLGFTALPRSAVEAFPFPERIQIAGLSTRVTEPVYLIIKQHRTLQPRYQLLIELLEKLWSSKANVD